MKKKALITGITGQDGAYLADFLIKKGYDVHGIKRRSSLINTHRVDHLYQDKHEENQNFFLHYGDMTDSMSLIKTIQEIQPDEIYNLAAMSHVKVSFELPEYTADANGVGTLRILEAVRILALENKTKIYQASTSELYGNAPSSPQNEQTPFSPRSPYAVAKLYAYWITVNYREAYNMFASNGILFNHESPLRGETFVMRKITRGIAQFLNGSKTPIYLGNIDAERDWGHAKDYVEAMWLMLQHDKADDFVIATGQSCSIRTLLQLAFTEVGINIRFRGQGVDEEVVVDSCFETNYRHKSQFSPEQVLVKIDPTYYRPSEVNKLLGDATKARKFLGWQPKYTTKDIISEMIKSDCKG